MAKINAYRDIGEIATFSARPLLRLDLFALNWRLGFALRRNNTSFDVTAIKLPGKTHARPCSMSASRWCGRAAAISPAQDFDIRQASNSALFWHGVAMPLSRQHLSSTSNDVCSSGRIGSKIAYIESGLQSALTEKK